MADQEGPIVPSQPPTVPPSNGGAGGGGPLFPSDNKNLIPINIEDEMKRSYLDYAMSVIVGRALPDVRDGLKPVHRRILYGMHEMGLQPNRPTRKCAKIVGEVMGKYHPHGDAPDLRRPGPHGAALLHALSAGRRAGQLRLGRRRSAGGRCGTPRRGLPASPPRCWRTSTRKPSTSGPTTTTAKREPEVLPTRVPNLLVNGSSGIAVGMATNIPPHNLTRDHRRHHSH